MMKFSEFQSMFPLISDSETSLQRTHLLNEYAEGIKKFIGMQMEIDNHETDYGSFYTSFEDITSDWIFIKYGSKSIYIYFENDKFDELLQSIRKYDLLKIIAVLKSGSFNKTTSITTSESYASEPTFKDFYGVSNFRFDLVSIDNVTEEIRLYDEKKRLEKEKKLKNEEVVIKSHSGCFIATACFGNYDAYEVKVLRQYRDTKLLTSIVGKTMVSIYYYFSPPLARFIVRSEMLKKIIRNHLLKNIVSRIERHKK